MQIKGSRVLITGGSKGIGKAAALAFIKAGADIAITYSSDRTGAKDVEQAAQAAGVSCVSIKADITSDSDVEGLVAAVKHEYGRIDVLINNAGIFSEDDSPDNLDAFRDIFEVNFLAQVRVTNALRPLMQQGRIIFVSSVHGRPGHGRPSAIAYSAMKAALDSFMKNLAKHLAPDILVNSVAPGKTLTPMWGEMDHSTLEKHAADHLTKRWIEPAEVADAIMYLAQSDSVCGEILTIDGGMSLTTLS
ncbi:MAG: General stress protein 39 [candidate division WS6 bacterium OLB20]|uniref:General stress protein 39 n=1 Tax=candidate division WS6 bacterium OLB20 TaxID=1617426 RepID=A0A136M136_9BACT|nr:MAG: General stress protein 39 [candidate division WS6 bacterium OLB20]